MIEYFAWRPLKFGKYKGKTLPQIVLRDPDWFFWAFDEGILDGPLGDEAAEIAWKARNIRIPVPDPRNWRVEYHILLDGKLLDGKFVGFSIVWAKNASDASIDTSYSITRKHLDLSFPRSLKTYDKLGNKMMLRSFRRYYFGGSRLTKEKCEKFFFCEYNFLTALRKPDYHFYDFSDFV